MTLKNPVRLCGIGLHTGCDVQIELRPAPEDTGIIFRRVDLQNFEIEARRDRVSRVVLATTLMKRGVMLSTVEHLLSALYGLSIDNLYVDINSLEVPILDGSAQPFVEAIKSAGTVEQHRERTYLCVERPIRISEGDKYITVEPAPHFRITYEIDFSHPAIGKQKLDFVLDPVTYEQEISFARTFGFYDEVEELRQKGLIRGGSFDNAVVLSRTDIMNGKLRASDEFVRHKVLDLIGDISLCGYPILGHVRAYKAGHALHTDLATALARSPKACRKIKGDRLFVHQISENVVNE
ncbi:MAG: UDP-3-O-acyl-N-acetylglucosamine deacetylase [Acidobacteria bacterium]|nr:UDP-3-O-acyl-N-acetylglucosamine deacetylase [Acidobacteriota bacterium]